MPYPTIQQIHQKINVKELINKLKNKQRYMDETFEPSGVSEDFDCRFAVYIGE